MKQCTFNGDGGCTNKGDRYPILLLPPPRPYSENLAARSACLVATCADCAEKVTIDNFLIEEARNKIATAFLMAGKMAPDFDRAWLEWGEVGDAMWDELSDAAAHAPARKLS